MTGVEMNPRCSLMLPLPQTHSKTSAYYSTSLAATSCDSVLGYHILYST